MRQVSHQNRTKKLKELFSILPKSLEEEEFSLSLYQILNAKRERERLFERALIKG